MNKHLRVQSVALVLGLVFGLASILPVTGCRGGDGSDCLSDSECALGLVCIKREKVIDEESYEERWGTCHEDRDGDKVPLDGDLSGSSYDRRCGVHVFPDPATGAEIVLESVIGKCDDNCPDVVNKRDQRKFVCLAKEDCCPATEKQKDKAKATDLCADIPDVVDTCAACSQSGNTGPEPCFLESNLDNLGYALDLNGCPQCRPQQDRIPCAGPEDCLAAVTAGLLPEPACSGEWGCGKANSDEKRYCAFSAVRRKVMNEKGFTVVWQIDSDWDGVGDSCDNCKVAPNGIECTNPLFELNCDVNQDSFITLEELAQGGQRNEDGDNFGDACDLCPYLADNDNEDLDLDGRGNPCDCDDDGDGICDPELTAEDCRDAPAETCQGSDNCPKTWNPNQRDVDGDDKGDLCDIDIDGDGIRQDGDLSGVVGDNPCTSGQQRNCDDNCPNTPNGANCRDEDDLQCDINFNDVATEAERALGNQLDSDGDGIGDACE